MYLQTSINDSSNCGLALPSSLQEPGLEMDNQQSRFRSKCLDELQKLRIFERVSEVTLQRLANSLQLLSFQSNETICTEGEEGTAMYVVVQGRVKVTRCMDSGERVLSFLDRNAHFGEMSLLTGERRTANVIAITNTQVIQIDLTAFELLQTTEPDFCTSICRTLADRLAVSVRSKTTTLGHRVVAAFYGSPRTFSMVQCLHDELDAMGAKIKLHQYDPSFTLDLQSRLGEASDLLILASPYCTSSQAMESLAQSDHILWFVDQNEGESQSSLDRLLANQPDLASRVHLVKCLGMVEGTPQELQQPSISLGRTFYLREAAGPREFQSGLRSIIRSLFDQRLGLALGGGGARGLAHLGVFRALDEEGIGVDLLAGTSMGALIGLSYAAGFSPNEAAALFRTELTPGRFFRLIPRGTSWFMISKFRFGGWEKMLRKHFQNINFSQLRVPLCTVSADLVSGNQIIRESGDCVNAILESINLPYIARPIVRDGQVIVDGGVLNNIPVDLLRPRGANTVLGVDVCSRLSTGFVQNSHYRKERKARRPTMLQTALRLQEIRRHHVSRSSIHAADQMLWIDTSDFEFENFSKSFELADRGYQVAKQAMPRLRELIDSRLAQSLKAKQ